MIKIILIITFTTLSGQHGETKLAASFDTAKECETFKEIALEIYKPRFAKVDGTCKRDEIET